MPVKHSWHRPDSGRRRASSRRGRFSVWLGALPVLALLVALPTAASPAAPGSPAARSEPPTEALVVGLVLNDTVLAASAIVHREGVAEGQPPPRVWLPQADALRWRLRTDDRDMRSFDGIPHIAFCGARERCFYDPSTSVLTLAVAPADVLPLQIVPGTAAPAPLTDAAAVGAWVRYDVSAWQELRPGFAVVLDGRLDTPLGHGLVALDTVLLDGEMQPAQAAALWQVDWPQKAVSMQFGNINPPATGFGWGQPLLGLRAGSSAGLQPTVSHAVRPVVTARANERAVRADNYVDGQYRQTDEVPCVPYSGEVAPTHSGRGELQVVGTDARDQQSRIDLPAYRAPQLLRPQAIEWSVDLGVPDHRAAAGMTPEGRIDANAQSAGDSGLDARRDPQRDLLLSAALRAGIDRSTTASTQLLAAPGIARVALAADHAEPRWGLGSLGLVWQRTSLQPQGRVWIGIGHGLQARDFSFGVRVEQALGGCGAAAASAAVDPLSRPCSQLAASSRLEIKPGWSATASASAQRDWSGQASHVAGVGLRAETGARSQWELNMQSTRVGGTRFASVLLSYSIPLGPRWNGRGGLRQSAGQRSAVERDAQSVEESGSGPERALRESPPSSGRVGDDAEIGARAAAHGQRVDWRGKARAASEGISSAVGVAGAVGIAGGRWFSTRRIDDAFVPLDGGLPDLPVLPDSHSVAAQTDAGGSALVADANAHRTPRVSVDTARLPID